MAVSISVQGVLIYWPQICPCCKAPADSEAEIERIERKGNTIKTVKVKAPFCRACVLHVPLTLPTWVKWPTVLGALLAGVLTFVLAPEESSRNGSAEALASVLTISILCWPLALYLINWWRQKYRRTPRCAPKIPVKITAEIYSGVTTFEFDDDDYAATFAAVNAGHRVY